MKTETMDDMHPTDDWFGKKELGVEKLHAFSYEVDGEKKKVAFWIRAISSNESRMIAAECENADGTLDGNKNTDELMLACVSYGENKIRLSQQQIDGMKRNKKGGLFGSLLQAVLLMSGADTEEIEAEKNLDGPIASRTS